MAFPIFLLNLDRSPESLAFMQEQFDRLGMKAERVRAVDGDKVRLPNPKIVDEAAFKWRHHAVLRRGEVGCYLSHLSAINLFLASGETVALILEDDVELSPDLPALLDAILGCADRWDLLKLYATHPGGIITRARIDDRHRLVSLAFRHGSAAAYLINRRAAFKLATNLLPMTVPYDHEFERAWKYGFKLRAVMPFPVSRRRSASTITTTRPVDATVRTVNARLHKPWYAQGGMVLFRGANDIARIVHELRQRP